MAIISQETFDKFTQEEKDKVRYSYNQIKRDNEFFKETEHPLNAEKVIESYETLFGKENLQDEPKIKTWEDVKDKSDSSFQTSLNLDCACDGNMDNKLFMKIKATYKIAKLIELGYGGMITEEEWKDGTVKCVIKCTPDEKSYLYEDEVCDDIEFIAFHTYKQRKEFMSYPENRKLVEQYYMI